jgi:hypothetical protein
MKQTSQMAEETKIRVLHFSFERMKAESRSD